MPRLNIDFKNTIIYKIVCRDVAITDCYVGHTTNFTNRKRLHKCDCEHKNSYVYRFINEHGGWGNWDMVMIEKYPCDNFLEACARERHWIETLKAGLNSNDPPTGLTKNKEKQNQTCREYYTKNKDVIKEQKAQYYVENKERKNQRVCCVLCRRELNRYCLPKHYTIIHNI